MIETHSNSVDNQPKGAARNPSETLNRDVGDSRRVTKPEEQDAALEAVGARPPGSAGDSGKAMAHAAAREPEQLEENLEQDRREAEQGLKPSTG